MNYVVIDLEWNQAMSSKSSVFNKLPIHLAGEIIEIGAVKLDSEMRPCDEFTVDIKPLYFKNMHYKVKAITGFDNERLGKGISFGEALGKLREWCGDDVIFITWGSDDRRILEQNIIVHDLDWDWIQDWINLQPIFNLQTGGDRTQKSLASAMEYFEIEQTRTAHDALGDAYNTALICSKLDMKEGLRLYPEADRILAERSNKVPTEESDDPRLLSHEFYSGCPSKAVALSDDRINELVCPDCGKTLTGKKWINQGDQRYMNLYTCKDGGRFLIRVRFRKNIDENTWYINRLVYRADDEMLVFYNEKSILARRRGRGHGNHRK